MAARFDVAARLMEGVGAVDEIQTYVEACRLRGYQHAGLTMTQIRDWYTAEEGLDLRVLDADCVTLRGIAGDAGEALRSARSTAVALADAWTGHGGAVAAEFVRRHCNTAEILVEALRVAAETTAMLRDDLWRVVDRRVAQTQEIVDRARAQRPVWLAAAHAVLAGGQADDDAVRTVDDQVKPFVDNAIGVDWVAAMRLADGDATAAFRAAVDRAGARARLRFEVPGDLGPRPSVPQGAMPAAAPTGPDAAAARMQVRPEATPLIGESRPAAADVAVPTTAPPPTPPVAAAPPPTPPVAAAPLPSPLDGLASVPALSPPGGLPGFGATGLPDLGGTDAMPGRLAEALSGLTDPAALPELDTPDELAPGDDPDEPGVDEGDGSGEADEPEADEPEADEPEAPGAGDDEREPIAPPAEPGCPDDAPAETAPMPDQPAPTPVPEPAPHGDPPPPAPSEATGTPCEIAADELPQAGQ